MKTMVFTGQKKIMAVFLCVLLIAALAVQLMGVQGANAAPTYITYARPLYSGTDDTLLNLVGNASIHDGGLYLTSNTANKVGSAFFDSKIKSTEGFSTFFEFSFPVRSSWSADSSQAGADGIVFIVSSAANQYGSDGQGIGYQGIDDSVGIEFDSYNNDNDKAWEASQSHIAVNVNGDDIVATEPKAYHLLDDNYFNDDGPFYAWIDYNADTNALQVRLNTSSVRPASATLSTTIDLSDYAGQEYFVGFTAATGGSRQNHIISQWLFSNTYEAGGLDPATEYSMDSTPPTAPTQTLTGTSVTIGESTDADSDLAGYEYKLDGGDWTAGTTASLSGLSAGTHTVVARALDNVGNISNTTSKDYFVAAVSYNNNGGSGSVAGGNYLEGTSLTLSGGSGVSKEGYTLSGWNTQADGKGTHYALGASITVPGSNLPLYAEWTSSALPTPTPTAATISHDVTIYVNGRSTLTASASGGTWNHDSEYLELTDNGDGTAKITGLKAGATTVTYTAGGLSETYKVTIKETTLPSTGQDFTWVWALGLAAAVVLAFMVLMLRKHKSRA